MAWGNFTFVSNAYTIENLALAAAQGNANRQFLGRGDDALSAATVMAQFLNECERDVFNDHPVLGRSVSTRTVSSGSRTVTIPATVQGFQLESLKWTSSSNEVWNKQIIPIVPREVGEARTGFELNTLAYQYPQFAYPNRDMTELILSCEVPAEQTFELEFRLSPTTFTAANLDDAASTNYSSVPTQYIDALYLKLAERLARTMGRMKSAEELNGLQQAASQRLMDQWEKIGAILQTSNTAPFGHIGGPLLERFVGAYSPMILGGTYGNSGLN